MFENVTIKYTGGFKSEFFKNAPLRKTRYKKKDNFKGAVHLFG